VSVVDMETGTIRPVIRGQFVNSALAVEERAVGSSPGCSARCGSPKGISSASIATGGERRS
jgi:hypothetical protein